MPLPERVRRGVRLATLAIVAIAAGLTGAVGRSWHDRSCIDRGPTPLPSLVNSDETAGLVAATDGLVFISVAAERSVRILDLSTGEQTILDAGISDPHEVAVSPDGRWGVAADFGDYLGDYAFSGQRLAVFDLRAKRLSRIIDLAPHRGPHEVIFISPTRVLVTVQTTQHVVEVDVVNGHVLRAIPTRAKGSHSMAVTADGRTAFTANQAEGSVSRLDLERGQLVARHAVAARGEVEGIAVTADGSEVWMGFKDGGSVLALDGLNGSVLATLEGFEMPDRMDMTRDGSTLVVTDFRCEVVQLVDVPGRRVIGPIAGLEGAGVAKILPDDRTALILMLDERVLALADLRTRRVIARYELGSRRPDAAAWGPPQR